MRIVLWNCNNGIGKPEKIAYLKSLAPDLAILPELREQNIEKICPEDCIWITNSTNAKPAKGLGILAFSGYRLERLPRDDEMEIFVPARVTKGSFSFNLLAVWNFYSACKAGRFRSVRGPEGLELSALRHYSSMLTDPSLVAGDWNLGPTFCQGEFLGIAKVLAENGLESLYHRFNSLDLKESRHPTFRSNRNRLHHLDHIFGSKSFCAKINSLIVDDFRNVVLSDHAPMVLDVTLTESEEIIVSASA